MNEEKQYSTLTKLAFKLYDKLEDSDEDECFYEFVTNNLPKGWQIEWFDCESDEDDLERNELLVERAISKSKKKHKVFTFAYNDSGYRDNSHIIIGAPSFEKVEMFLKDLLAKLKN
jgi:hypothetical protein